MLRRDFCKKGIDLAVAASFYKLLAASSAKAKPSDLVGGDAREMLHIPPGFTYHVIDRTGDVMSDGFLVPGDPDGMACFQAPDGQLILMRNHELSDDELHKSPFKPGQKLPSELYDRRSIGGVSRVALDPKTAAKLESNLVLAGSQRNCAGGISPWGWLSCEETMDPKHGYVFLCNPHATRLAAPHPIPSYGRFNHEAALVDPSDLNAYLTEDRDDSCFYRFLPKGPKTPFEGKLQALKIKGEFACNTSKKFQIGDRCEVEWVDIQEACPQKDSVRYQGRELGAAIIRRGEGLWLFERKVYFSATTGGPMGSGQIFCLHLHDHQTQSLELIAQPNDRSQMDMPDNLTVSPEGHLFFAEDGWGDQYIRFVTATGEIKNFARNTLSSSEITGLCFAPDGQTLFFNLQNDGITLAVRGPFAQWCQQV